MHKETSGTLPIIGVGGISSARTTRRAMFDAGASLIQLYTGLIYQGPGLDQKDQQGAAVTDLLDLDRKHVWHPYAPMPGTLEPLLVDVGRRAPG